MTIYIYNQNCGPAGHTVSQAAIDNYDGDPDNAGDWTGYTADDLPYLDKRAAEAVGGNAAYWTRVARTLREVLGIE